MDKLPIDKIMIIKLNFKSSFMFISAILKAPLLNSKNEHKKVVI